MDELSKSIKYPNVDFSKWKVNKYGCRQFLAHCPRCDKEKGYVREANYSTNCKSCSSSLNKRGKPSPKKGIKTGLPAWNRSKNFDPIKIKLRNRMSRRMRHALSGRNLSKSWIHIFTILGYSVDELKTHIESKFQLGMSWDNIGKWHIDHIIPESLFHYSSYEDDNFKKCWGLDNLQPLWAKDNIAKSNKLLGGVLFQPQ